MIKLEHISKRYGSLKIFDDFSLEFPEGKITAVLGPSGCGKTTLLNILAGLIKVDQGNVVTTDNVSYLFQEPRLLPWLTIKQNIGLVLKDKMPDREINRRVEAKLATTGLIQFADYYPSQLSGGMRQRAAMARAFVGEAPLLLMDEPFKSLDFKTRFQLVNVLLDWWLREPRTVVIVTHDVREAVMLGDKIVVFSERPVVVKHIFKGGLWKTERQETDELLQSEREILQLLLK